MASASEPVARHDAHASRADRFGTVARGVGATIEGDGACPLMVGRELAADLAAGVGTSATIVVLSVQRVQKRRRDRAHRSDQRSLVVWGASLQDDSKPTSTKRSARSPGRPGASGPTPV